MAKRRSTYGTRRSVFDSNRKPILKLDAEAYKKQKPAAGAAAQPAAGHRLKLLSEAKFGSAKRRKNRTQERQLWVAAGVALVLLLLLQQLFGR